MRGYRYELAGCDRHLPLLRASATAQPALRLGSRGPLVADWQRILNSGWTSPATGRRSGCARGDASIDGPPLIGESVLGGGGLRRRPDVINKARSSARLGAEPSTDENKRVADLALIEFPHWSDVVWSPLSGEETLATINVSRQARLGSSPGLRRRADSDARVFGDVP